MRQRKTLDTEDSPLLAYNVIKGHNSRIVKGTPSKIEIDLCFMNISVKVS